MFIQDSLHPNQNSMNNSTECCYSKIIWKSIFIQGQILGLMIALKKVLITVLCSLTSLQVLQATESWSNYFLQQLLSLILSFLSEISQKLTKNFKKLKNQIKKTTSRYPSGSLPAFACRPAISGKKSLKKV